MMSPLAQIATGRLPLGAAVGLHAVFVPASLRPIRALSLGHLPARALWREIAAVLSVLFGLAVAFPIEAVIWAVALGRIGALADLSGALCFVLVTITTPGIGDLALAEGVRQVAGLCALSALSTIGMTAAYPIELLRRFVESEDAG